MLRFGDESVADEVLEAIFTEHPIFHDVADDTEHLQKMMVDIVADILFIYPTKLLADLHSGKNIHCYKRQFNL